MACQLVEIQQTKEPKVTKNAPCQKVVESWVCNIHIEMTDEKIGLKYDSVTNSVMLP